MSKTPNHRTPSVGQPIFSVIIPVHNKAQQVARSIRSVLNQNFRDFELLLIDDASTDNSLTEICRFSDPRIRVFRRDRPGAGGYAARNLGIERASAEWVLFLDADDEWFPDHLDLTNRLVQQEGPGVVATGWLDIHADGHRIPNSFSVYHRGVELLNLGFTEFLKETTSKRRVAWTGAIGIRRRILHAVGGFPESCIRGGDTATWLRAVHLAGGILAAPRVTAAYHREDSGVTKRTPPPVQGNCVYLACRSLLMQTSDKLQRRLLMSFSNMHVTYGLTRRRVSGVLRFSDCNMHYFIADWRTHLFLRGYSLLPRFVQRNASSWYQGLKRLRPKSNAL